MNGTTKVMLNNFPDGRSAEKPIPCKRCGPNYVEIIRNPYFMSIYCNRCTQVESSLRSKKRTRQDDRNTYKMLIIKWRIENEAKVYG